MTQKAGNEKKTSTSAWNEMGKSGDEDARTQNQNGMRGWCEFAVSTTSLSPLGLKRVYIVVQ